MTFYRQSSILAIMGKHKSEQDKLEDALKDHDCGTECVVCRDGIEAARARDREGMEKYGWTAHIVVDDPELPFEFNYHTHGFTETFGCPDMQIVFPMPPESAHGIMHTIVGIMRKGHRFKLGEISDKILRDHNVTFARAEECDREVYRVILPDPSGDVNRDSMDKPYKDQWIGCNL